MKETEKIMDHYRSLFKSEDSDDLNSHVSKMLGLMAKILAMIEDEKTPKLFSPDNKERGIILADGIDPLKARKGNLYSYYSNLRLGLFQDDGIWKSTLLHERKSLVKRLSPNIYQFCEYAEKLFLTQDYEFSRLSELIFTLLELNFDEEAQLIQEALHALEIKGSEYEFCGKIRSTLEKITIRTVLLMNEKNRGSIFNNLHTLIKRKIIEKKLAGVIASNYSYGSQFIHQERKFDLKESKMFVDQTLLHTEKILSKIKEFIRKDNKEEKEE